jgi:subtilisin family serine protease
MPEPPARWNGSCIGSRRTRCNRKLIGARSFTGDYDPEDDEEVGHGTHVVRIAAGNFVRGASLGGGLASGTAAGIAPLAHIAVYKVCNRDGCEDSSISCGLDAAVRDGVDVINLSLGSMLKRSFHMDPIAIGAFSAMAKGVLVVSAAGNSGPARYTLCNDAPWMLTVGAGTVDRRFDAELDWEYAPNFASGEALVQDTSTEGVYTLVYCDTCQYTSNIAGKLVLCTAVQRGADQAFIIRRLQHFGAACWDSPTDRSHQTR